MINGVTSIATGIRKAMAASVELPVDAIGGEIVTEALSEAPIALSEDTVAVFELSQLPVLDTRALANCTTAASGSKFPRGPLGFPPTHWKQDPRVSCKCTS